MITKYAAYNESIRDKMTPVSQEEIHEKLKGMDSDEILQALYKGPSDDLLFEFFNEDEVIRMIRDLKPERKGVFLRVSLAYRDYKFTKMLLDGGADPNLDEGWPLRYVTNWKEEKLIDLLKKYGATDENL